MEQWPVHYAHTCRRWLERTRENRAEIVELYDERFFRMWEFYLAGSITTFETGGSTDYQLQYVRERTAVPTDRDYMLEDEKPLRAALDKARAKGSSPAKRAARVKTARAPRRRQQIG
jgi:cyclopropane-fatty-acyl-phospholipid synthase